LGFVLTNLDNNFHDNLHSSPDEPTQQITSKTPYSMHPCQAMPFAMQVGPMPTMLHAGGRAPEIEEKKKGSFAKRNPK